MNLFLAIFLSTLIAGRRTPTEMQRTEAWYVDHVDGDLSQYELSRGHEYADLVFLEHLHPSDVLSVKTPSGKIYLVQTSGNQEKTRIICATKKDDCTDAAPFTIPRDASADEGWGIRWLSKGLARQRQHPEEVRVQRGGAIRVPLLSAGPVGMGRMRILPGQRDFVLAWQGCAPPYSVRVYESSKATRDSSSDVISVKELKEEFLRVPDINLQAPRYEVEIRCTDYTVGIFRGQFDVVRTSEPPAAPPQLLEDTPRSLVTLLTTAWISSADQGVWEFEAYLRLMNQTSRSANEELLAKTMELGEGLEAPPDLK